MKALLAVIAIAGTVVLVAVLVTGNDDGDKATTSTPDTTTAPATQQEAVPAVVNVSIGDNFYEPTSITIKRGQSISWRNGGGVDHTVTSDSASAVEFDSGTIGPRGAYALKPRSGRKADLLLHDPRQVAVRDRHGRALRPCTGRFRLGSARPSRGVDRAPLSGVGSQTCVRWPSLRLGLGPASWVRGRRS